MTPRRTIVLLLSIALFVAWTAVFWSYSMDDAFISYRYAEHLADGHGLTFNIGDKPVEGYSNFLWVLLLAALYKVGLPTYLTAKLLGLGCSLAAGLLWYRYFIKRNDLSWLVGPLFLIAPITAFWGLSGLELGLHALLIASAFIAYQHRSVWLHPLLALIVVSRPEGVAVALVLLAAGLFTHRENWREQLKYHLIALGVVVLTMAGLTALRLAVFGYLLPNTYYVKAQFNYSTGYYELALMLLRFAPFTLGLLWATMIVIRRRFRDPDITPAIALVAVQAIISASVDPIMNYYFRYLIPFLPLFLAPALHAMSEIPRSLHRIACVGLAAVSLMVPAPALVALIPENEAVVAAQMKAVEWLNQQPASATVSISDLGRIPYYTKQRYNDIYGLANEDVGHHGFNSDRELARLPDFFVFVGHLEEDGTVFLRFWREKNIAHRDVFQKLYEAVEACTADDVPPTTPGYHYIIARRLPGAQRILIESMQSP